MDRAVRASRGRRRREVLDEPVARQLRHPLQRTRFLEQVRRPRDDADRRNVTHAPSRVLVQLDHDVVAPTDDQQRRRADQGEGVAREVRPTSARSAPGFRRFCAYCS